MIMEMYRKKIYMILIYIYALFSFLFIFRNKFIERMLSFNFDIIQMQNDIRFIFCMILFFYCIFTRKKISRTTKLFLLIFIWILVSTLYNDGLMILARDNFSKIIFVLLCLETIKNDEKKLLGVLNTWKWIIFLLVVIDLCTEILYPSGLYSELKTNNWFLGYKTERVVYSLPMAVLFIYTSLKEHNKINVVAYITTIIAIIGTILSGAGAAGVAFLLFLGGTVFVDILHRKKIYILENVIKNMLNYKLVLTLYLVFDAIIIFSSNTKLGVFISQCLGKGDHYSGRTKIWVTCIKQIVQKPFTGVGYIRASDYVNLVNMPAGTNAHNMILTLLMHGGIVVFLVYIALFGLVSKKPKNLTMIDEILTIYLYAILVLGITSSTLTFSIFCMLGFWLLEYNKTLKYEDNLNDITKIV